MRRSTWMGMSTGAVTFLFTDVVGSTRWWEEHPEEMGAALRLHDTIIKDAVEANEGEIFATGGDGFAVAFEDPNDAARAASAAQAGLASAAWDETVLLLVRMAIHSGVTEARGGDYFGPTLNRAARLMSAGHGGQVLVSEATKGLLDPDRWQLSDLGRHRLKDVTHLQRIFQLGDDTFDALTSIQRSVGNLSQDRTSFIGRGKLIDDVFTAIGEAPLVTLTGVGGVGKTRIAIEVARRFAETSRDGAWLCSLTEAESLDAVVETVNLALRIRPIAELSPIGALTTWLSGRELLLLLDNCEHVIDATADLVESILDTAPRVRILATSREGIAVRGERLLAVSALGLPSRESPEESESVELFVARTLDVRSDFNPGTSAEAIAEICRRVDGIPLAIELAAARAETMSADDILDNLDQRFELLTGGRGRRRERHQTLRYTVRWSYDLLVETEQVVFRRLSVFAASFELDAAVRVCATFAMSRLEIIDTLSSLCRKSLVQIEDHDGLARYRYLETTRAFAEELSEEAGELEPAMTALTAWLTEWVQQFPALYLGCRIDEASSIIDPEEPNLRRVLNWARDNEDPATVAAVFAPFGLFVLWGGDRVALLAAEYVDMPAIDQTPGADSILALAGFAAYENFDLARGRALTERGCALEARAGKAAYACELTRWTLEFILAGDREVRSRAADAWADATARGLDLVAAVFEATLLCHDAVAGSLELMDSGSAAVRQHAVEFDAPMFEMLTELICGIGEKHRDLDQARVHLDRAAELDGLSQLFIGNVIRQELASHAILTDDDEEATVLGAHLARHAAAAGRQNFSVLAAVILTGPLVQCGDAEVAAEFAGWASASPFASYWLQEISHVTARARDSLTPDRFDEAFSAGRKATFEDMFGQILDQLATIEALIRGGASHK